MKVRTKRIALFFCLGLVVISSFQNCGKNSFNVLEVRDVNQASLQQPVPEPQDPTDGEFISAESAGQQFHDFNECRDSDEVLDACIFIKNPVHAKGSPFSLASGEVLAYGTNLTAYQSFGVKLKNLDGSGTLSSTRGLVVYYTGADSRRSPFYRGPAGDTNPIFNNPFQLDIPNGKKFRAYQDDGTSVSTGNSDKATAQLMAYFWIQHLGDELLQRTKINWTDNKVVMVDAYTTDARYGGLEKRNAFYQGYLDSNDSSKAGAHEIVMGYATAGGAPRHEMALSAEIYLHEMGHANLFQAAGMTIYGDDSNTRIEITITKCSPISGSPYSSGSRVIVDSETLPAVTAQCGGSAKFDYSVRNTFCKTNLGCMDAMNEGQADFHYLMMFPFATALGETVTNTMAGFGTSPIYLAGAAGASACGAVDVTKPAVPRDVRGTAPGAGRVQDYFVGSSLQYNLSSNAGVVPCGLTVPGEIHGMGSLYAKILWEIYSRSTNKRAFERSFQRTLANYTGSANFSTARGFLLTDDQTFEGGINRAIITQVFNDKGIP